MVELVLFFGLCVLCFQSEKLLLKSVVQNTAIVGHGLQLTLLVLDLLLQLLNLSLEGSCRSSVVGVGMFGGRWWLRATG